MHENLVRIAFVHLAARDGVQIVACVASDGGVEPFFPGDAQAGNQGGALCTLYGYLVILFEMPLVLLLPLDF